MPCKIIKNEKFNTIMFLFEDTEGVFRIFISKKDRQHNGQKKKDNNDKQNIIQKTTDRATRTPLQTVGEVRCSGRVGQFKLHMWHHTH
jgi:regulatory protein YycH of two-component signal transduction system YycFG